MADDIVVTGAKGTTGRRVARLLREAGARVREASRSSEARFDWAVPETWEPAVRGASGLYLMAPDGQEVDSAFVACAVEAGVRRIVLLSSRAIDTMGDERLLAAERTVRGAGVEWTVLRADWFDQNFDEGFLADAVAAGTVAVPVGDVRQSFVDAGDIAAVAATALLTDGHAGELYEVTGPEALSFAEACALLGDVRFLGGAEDYRAAMSAFGFPAEQLEAEIAAFTALAAAGDATPTDTVARVTGRPPRSFADYAAGVKR